MPRASAASVHAGRGRPRAARAGFTLLEVLAAIALLGIVFVVLGGSGIQGLQHEGEARRRLTASLLADHVIAEIEAGLEQGASPPLGEEEREHDGYAIAVAVEPLDLVLPEVEEPRALERRRERGRRPGEARRETQEQGPSLLVGEAGQPSPLRRIEVRVVWSEGFGERSVVRTTFGLDATQVQEQLAALDAAAASARGGEGGGGRGNRDGSDTGSRRARGTP